MRLLVLVLLLINYDEPHLSAEIPETANIITDFTSDKDVLGIAGLGIGFDGLSITQQEDNTLITANGSNLAILQGITADSLVADNFAFG